MIPKLASGVSAILLPGVLTPGLGDPPLDAGFGLLPEPAPDPVPGLELALGVGLELALLDVIKVGIAPFWAATAPAAAAV